jgi:chromosomal replication initiator protein
MAWEIVGDYAGHTPVLDLESIITHICRGFGLTREQLHSSSRKQEYVYARNTAFFLARKHTDLSLEAIGKQFNRKHSTVMKGITSFEREISRETPLGLQLSNTLTMIERNGNITARAGC